MILSELVRGNEDHPAYRALEVANGGRHYDFLESVVETAMAVGKPFLSQTVIKAINYHAIACLHSYAGLDGRLRQRSESVLGRVG